MRNLVQGWAQELSEHLKRPVEVISSGGLSAYDFSPRKFVNIIFPDGSSVNFKYAFAIISEKRRAVAVFTEHCGYYEFPLLTEMSITQRTEDVYYVE